MKSRGILPSLFPGAARQKNLERSRKKYGPHAPVLFQFSCVPFCFDTFCCFSSSFALHMPRFVDIPFVFFIHMQQFVAYLF